MNLLYPPTSAYYAQSKGEHIQGVRRLPGHLRHILSRE